jgi:hypothetical protein
MGLFINFVTVASCLQRINIKTNDLYIIKKYAFIKCVNFIGVNLSVHIFAVMTCLLHGRDERCI